MMTPFPPTRDDYGWERLNQQPAYRCLQEPAGPCPLDRLTPGLLLLWTFFLSLLLSRASTSWQESGFLQARARGPIFLFPCRSGWDNRGCSDTIT